MVGGSEENLLLGRVCVDVHCLNVGHVGLCKLILIVSMIKVAIVIFLLQSKKAEKMRGALFQIL